MTSPALAEKEGEADLTAYLCPRTGARLHWHEGKVLAEGNGPEYDAPGGIPNFLRYGNNAERDDATFFERLNENAVRSGWKEALDQAYGATSGMVAYATDPARLKLLDLLPLSPESVVLEIGPGMGQMTAAIASRVKRCHGLEVVPGQAVFALERCRQQGATNVAMACGGDDCRLPYADSYFDAVIMNLVLEWCAARNLEDEHCVGQRRLLAELARVIKPGGKLLLSTKNRFALGYVLGRPDEHSHMLRFGSALPRTLQWLLLKVTGKGRPGGHLYSHRKLKQLLADAGFRESRSYWAAPEMRFARAFVPTDAASVRAARKDPGFEQADTRKLRFAMGLVPDGWVKHVTPGLLFVAERSADES